MVDTSGRVIAVVNSCRVEVEVLMAALRAWFSSLVVVSLYLSWVISVASCIWILLMLLNSYLM